MKYQIRRKVWETNSSLCHSLQLMSKEEYEDLCLKDESDDWVWDCWDDEWVNVNSDDYDECGDYEEHYFDDEAEYDIKEYTTSNGDVVVGISKVKQDY